MIGESPMAPVDVSGQGIRWDGDVIPPPPWWSSLDFSDR